MGWRGVVAMALALSGLMAGVQAQPWQPGAWRTDWWRNGATLDMDFANNRYMVSLTTPVTYTSLTQFITAVSGTFTRAGANETATGDPFYLTANQSFVSRATSTTQLTATGSPFYADASQAFYSRATSATYIDSSGVVQTAAANVARTNYIYNGSSWVSGGTLIEPARTDAIDNGYFTGAATGIIGTMSTVSGTGGGHPNKWGVSGWSPNNWGLNTQVVGLGTSNGLRYIDIRYYGTASGTNGSSWTGLYPGAPNQVAASSGQSWSGSVYLAVVSGSLTNITRIAAGISCRDISGSSIEANNPVITDTSSLTSVLTRYSASLTCTTASTTYVALNVPSVNLQNGPIDVTFRLAGPQLELGASPTSYIATSGSTVTRAADVYTQETASYFNSAGVLKFATAGAARADYNPGTLAYRGILAEPARTNLVKYSSQPGSGNWYYLPSYTTITADSAVAPDGMLTADRVSTTAYMIAPGLGVVSGTTYTFSVWLKSPTGTSQSYNLWIEDSAPSDVTLAARSVTANGNWQRFSISATAPTQTSNFLASIRGGYYYMWGTQVEAGVTPTSYIPTWATTASRAADVYTSGYSGTYFDASGTLRNAPANTPRLDYDPSTSEPKGVLIEEARTNVAASDITAFPWSSNGTVTLVSNAAVAPDGTLTAHSLTCETSNCNRYLNMSGVSGTTYTFSFFTKSASCSRGRSGTAVGGGVTYISTTLGNGWIRHGFTETVVSPGTWLPQIINYNTIGTPCIVWGPQVEVGAFPTSYIPTSGSSVTRPADVFTLPTSTGWYNAAGKEGTLGTEALTPAYYQNGIIGTIYPGFVSLDDGTTNSAIHLFFSDNPNNFQNMATEIKTNGANTYSTYYTSGYGSSYPNGYSLNSYPAQTLTKGLIAFAANDIKGSYNGLSLNKSTTASSLPDVTLLRVGARRGGAGLLNGYIRRVWYMPTRQPDESLPDYTR